MWRVHTCFRECKDYEADRAYVLDKDREPCGESDLAKTNLLCVFPDDDCEKWTKVDEICIDDKEETCFNLGAIWIAIALANICQLIIEAA